MNIIPGPGTDIFPPELPVELDAEQERQKRQIYEKMSPRRRKFIDRIGYEQWNPFQEPKEPLDIRTDISKRTIQQLCREFMAVAGSADKGAEWRKGVMECAMGIVQKNEKYQGIYDFCIWYSNLLRKEGHL